MPDSLPDPYDSYPIKDNNWFKNNVSHKMMRAKQNSGPYCTFCCHRCYDPNTVHGRRSLKKSKVITYHHTKFYVNSDVNPHFMDRRNGEAVLEDDA